MNLAKAVFARILVLSLVVASPGLAPYAAAAQGSRGDGRGVPLPGAPALPALSAIPKFLSAPPVVPPSAVEAVAPSAVQVGVTPVSIARPVQHAAQIVLPELARPPIDAARALPAAQHPAIDSLGAIGSWAPEPARASADGDKGGAGRGFDTPEAPKAEGPSDAVSAPKAPIPGGKGFVPATKKLAALATLMKKDPDAGIAQAFSNLHDQAERRMEVQLGSLRLLEGQPLDKTRARLVLTLTTMTAEKPLILTLRGRDEQYYLQREILRQLSAEAATSEAAVDAARAAYQDPNAAVRLMAGHALRQWGIDPGPEKELAAPKVSQGPRAWDANGKPQKPSAGRKLLRLTLWLAASLFMINLLTTKPEPPAAPAPAPSAQVEKAPDAKAPTIEESLKRIEEHAKRSSEADERTAKAIEKATTPKPPTVLGTIGGIIMALLPIGLILFLLIWMQRKMGSGLSGAKNSKIVEERPTTRFSDVAGIDESQIEVQEIMDFLANPAKYTRMGGRVPKGVLMKGPPGTGKTLLGRAMAGEAGVPFLYMSGSDFLELFVGVGAARVRGLFEQAKAKGPAIIFIDEIDAIGRTRGGSSMGGGHDEREQTLNALLTQMDGFDNSTGVVVIAATNRPEVLDPALVRPGRFDRHIDVAPPQVLGREAILQVHARGARLGPAADLRYVAQRTAGLSGAFLEGIVNEAALNAVRRDQDSIGLKDLDEAVDAVTIGKARNLHLPEKIKRRIAVHEGGHALANLLGPNPSPVNKFTIIPHGTKALGFAETGSQEGDQYLYEEDELMARVEMSLGGAVAEKLYFGKWSTGPGSDFRAATDIVRGMVQELGMGKTTGLAVTSADPRHPLGASPASQETLREVDLEIKRIFDEALARVTKRLTENKDKLDALVAAVVEKETLTREEIEAIVWPDGKTPFGDSAEKSGP